VAAVNARPERGAASLWELLGLGRPEETAWMRDALCAQVDTDGFFPERGQPTDAVRAVCRLCPVAVECRTYAVVHNERFGFWGGTSPEQRSLLRRGLATEADLRGAA